MTEKSFENSISIDLERSFGALEESVVITGPDRTILFVNRAAEDILGYSKQEMIGRVSEFLFANPEDFHAVGQIYSERNPADAHNKFSMQYRRKNGRVFTAEVVSAALYDSVSKHIGFLSIARDITDRLALETMLSDAASTLEDALDTISEGFALYDKEDRLIICNEKYREIYSHSAPAIIPGKSFEEILQYGLDRMEYDTRGKTDEEWLEDRLKWHQSADGQPIEQLLGNGTWLQISERPTRSGGRVGIRTDITELKAAQQKAEQAHRDLSLLADNLTSAITEVDLEGNCVFINKVAAQWFNGTREEILGTKIRNRFPEATRNRTEPFINRARSGIPTSVEMEITFPDNVAREAFVEYTPKIDENGKQVGLIVFANDITDRKRTERTLAELYTITSAREHESDEKISMILSLGCRHFGLDFGIVSNIVDEHYTVTHVETPNGEIPVGVTFPLGETYCVHTYASNSPIAIEHTAASELADHPCYEKFALETYIGAPLLVDGQRHGTINFTSAQKRLRKFSQTDREIIRQFADWVGNEIARQRDHKALMEAHARLERIASIDDLTGILNRRAFMERAATEISRYRRTGKEFSAVMLDIDHFKSINDTYGHAAGDNVLKAFVEIINNGLRTVDVFGRVGGEEFCIILDGSVSKDALMVCERIRRNIEDRCRVEPISWDITCSMGITTVTKEDVEFSMLLQRADQALYQAKENGRNCCVLFQDERQSQANTI